MIGLSLALDAQPIPPAAGDGLLLVRHVSTKARAVYDPDPESQGEWLRDMNADADLFPLLLSAGPCPEGLVWVLLRNGAVA